MFLSLWNLIHWSYNRTFGLYNSFFSDALFHSGCVSWHCTSTGLVFCDPLRSMPSLFTGRTWSSIVWKIKLVIHDSFTPLSDF